MDSGFDIEGAQWVDVSSFGSPYDEQVDVSAMKGERRHRPRKASSMDDDRPWVRGPAPSQRPRAANSDGSA